jgi:hypothetical protein
MLKLREGVWYAGRMESSALKPLSSSALSLAFSFFALFNFLDLSTTIIALKTGLTESNSLLIALSRLLDQSLINSIIISKVSLLGCAGIGLFVGIGSRNQTVKKQVFGTLLVLTGLFAFASLNNFYALFAVIQ